MPIKGFRVWDQRESKYCSPHTDPSFINIDCRLYSMNGHTLCPKDPNLYTIQLHTGVFDRNNLPIYEGDTLRQKGCDPLFVVNNIVDFLIMCGNYQAKNGVEIFPSLEIVENGFSNL